MNIIELLFIIVSIANLVLFILNRSISKKTVFILVVGTLIVFGLHLSLNLIRWQLYPLYLINPFMLGLFVLKLKGFYEIKTAIRYSINTVFILLVFSSVVAVFSFPVYSIPKPSGENLIGTMTFDVEDSSREELYSDANSRRFTFQVWYPAETIDGFEQAPWLEGGRPLARSLAEDNWLPYFALDHVVYTMSNSYYNAPLKNADSPYPVIVISHGWRGFSTLHTDIAEELASLGYIVISIDHTYGSVATSFKNGDIEYLNLDALKPRETNENFLFDANQLVNTYAQDIVKTIDELEVMNNDVDSFFYNALDFDKLGLIGHSTGGGAGVEAALNDTRIDAVLGLDSWVEPIGLERLGSGLTIPSLFLRSGSWETGENNQYLYELINNSNENATLYQVNGTTHYDFAMVYMYSPLTKYIGFTGDVESDRLVIILKDVIDTFFDQEMNPENTSLEEPSRYDEINKIETQN